MIITLIPASEEKLSSFVQALASYRRRTRLLAVAFSEVLGGHLEGLVHPFADGDGGHDHDELDQP